MSHHAVIKTHESFHLQVGKPRCVECQTSGGADESAGFEAWRDMTRLCKTSQDFKIQWSDRYPQDLSSVVKIVRFKCSRTWNQHPDRRCASWDSSVMELQPRSAPSKQLLARAQAFPHTCHTGQDETCWSQNCMNVFIHSWKFRISWSGLHHDMICADRQLMRRWYKNSIS